MTPPRASALALPLAVGSGALAAAVLIAAADPQTPGGPIPVCPTKALLGIDCPGCGSMRMIQSLVNGDLLGALHFNALGVVALVFLLWSYASWTAERLGRRIPSWTQWRYAAVTTGTLVAVWTIVRILPWEPFLSLRV